MLTHAKVHMAALAVFLSLGSIASWQSFSEAARTQAEPIALHEAEILIYLMPAAKEIRHEGMEISWEQSEDPALNQKGYYFFWVYNARRSGTASVTVGHYAVNKHTAAVWDILTSEKIISTELEGVQRILRKTHHIDTETLRRYQAPDFWVPNQTPK